MQAYKLQTMSECIASDLANELNNIGATAVPLGSAVLLRCPNQIHNAAISAWVSHAYTDGLTQHDQAVLDAACHCAGDWQP